MVDEEILGSRRCDMLARIQYVNNMRARSRRVLESRKSISTGQSPSLARLCMVFQYLADSQATLQRQTCTVISHDIRPINVLNQRSFELRLAASRDM
jgi:hypothetical protein